MTLLYSFFESSFRELAKTEREKRKIKLKIGDLKGNGINLYKDYFTKVIGIELSSIEPIWIEIDKARKIRNFIVHNESENSDVNKLKQIKAICQENPYLNYYVHGNDIDIHSANYLTDFSVNIETYLKGLIEILKR